MRCSLDLLGNQFAEYHLLSEILRSDHDPIRMRARRQSDAHQYKAKQLRETPFNRSETEIRDQSKHRSRDGTCENDSGIHHRYSAKDIHAKASRADCRRNSRHSDSDYGRYANACENHTEGKWNFDLPEKLRVRHPHSPPRFAYRGVHSGNADERILDDRKQ